MGLSVFQYFFNPEPCLPRHSHKATAGTMNREPFFYHGNLAIGVSAF
jgi:hypothetical protein